MNGLNCGAHSAPGFGLGGRRGRGGRIRQTGSEAQRPTVVELFAGIDAGDIEVKVFPKDAAGGNITVKNKTGKPLTIKCRRLRRRAGAAQVGRRHDGRRHGWRRRMAADGWRRQSGLRRRRMGGMGGGMGGMGGMMGGGGGMFNVAPDKVTKIKFVSVCLDHGLKDPNPRVPYKLIPIESYAKDAAVTEVIKLMVQRQARSAFGSGRGLAPAERPELGRTGQEDRREASQRQRRALLHRRPTAAGPGLPRDCRQGRRKGRAYDEIAGFRG